MKKILGEQKREWDWDFFGLVRLDHTNEEFLMEKLKG